MLAPRQEAEGTCLPTLARVRPPPRDPELRPERALLHPLWLLALAVLAINDHLLKGAGLLPEVLTGKLSDVAGLIVAPVALAALLRVRSAMGLKLCWAAVGAGFAALQLSPQVAEAWRQATAVLGMPWTTVSDAADLLALPALVLPWAALVPVMRQRAALRPTLRWLRGSALGAGVAVCLASGWPEGEQLPEDVACQDDLLNAGPCDAELCWDAYGQAVYCSLAVCGTVQWDGTAICSSSTPEEDCHQRGGEWRDGTCLPACYGVRNSADECVFSNDDVALFLYNATDETAQVRLLALAPGVVLDCQAVAADPGAHLKRSLFTAAGSWVLGPGQVRPLQTGTDDRACGAVVVASGIMRDQLVFWTGLWTMSVWDEPEVSRLNSRQGVMLTGSAERAEIESLDPVVQVTPLTPVLRPGEVPAECGGAPDDHRLAWGEALSVDQPLRIDTIDEAADGCLGLSLTPVDTAWQAPERWYACLDADRFPFAEGDVIERPSGETDPNALTLWRLGRSEEGSASLDASSAVALHLLREPTADALASLGLTLEQQAPGDCPALADSRCGTVSQVVALAVTDGPSNQTAVLNPGDSVAFARPDGSAVAVDLLRSARRPVVATACSEGPDALGEDVELVVIERPADVLTEDGEKP